MDVVEFATNTRQLITGVEFVVDGVGRGVGFVSGSKTATVPVSETEITVEFCAVCDVPLQLPLLQIVKSAATALFEPSVEVICPRWSKRIVTG